MKDKSFLVLFFKKERLAFSSKKHPVVWTKSMPLFGDGRTWLFFKKERLFFSEERRSPPCSKQKTFMFCALLMLSGCMAGGAPRLTVQDADDVRHVQDYLNHTEKFSARFVQSGAYGPGAGLVWLDRPGNLRIDYAGPGARMMVISGGRVRVLDRRTGALTTMALSRTPLGILLAPTIDLFGPVTVTSVQHVGGELEMTLQKTGAPGQGNLTLYLSQRPLQLQAVTVTDAYQNSSTLTLSGINLDPALTPDLFAPPVGPAGS
jgi:outer membrane lipoprotein-sorting protein